MSNQVFIVGRTLDRCFNRMGAKRFYKRGEGDESNDTEKAFQDWMHGMYPIIEKYHVGSTSFFNLG